MRGISWLADDLLAFQEGPYSMEYEYGGCCSGDCLFALFCLDKALILSHKRPCLLSTDIQFRVWAVGYLGNVKAIRENTGSDNQSIAR